MYTTKGSATPNNTFIWEDFHEHWFKVSLRLLLRPWATPSGSVIITISNNIRSKLKILSFTFQYFLIDSSITCLFTVRDGLLKLGNQICRTQIIPQISFIEVLKNYKIQLNLSPPVSAAEGGVVNNRWTDIRRKQKLWGEEQ